MAAYIMASNNASFFLFYFIYTYRLANTVLTVLTATMVITMVRTTATVTTRMTTWLVPLMAAHEAVRCWLLSSSNMLYLGQHTVSFHCLACTSLITKQC